ncbi:MAG: hypothetical protein LUD48_03220 [Prevotella sp.]|nr:hypothetical protein [Prevotella sp.]
MDDRLNTYVTKTLRARLTNILLPIKPINTTEEIMNISDNDYIATYQWMQKLDLTLAETTIYALIYGFKNGMTCTKEYIQARTGLHMNTIKNTLKRLKDRQLITVEKAFGYERTYICTPCSYEPSTTQKRIVLPLKENDNEQSTSNEVTETHTTTAAEDTSKKVQYADHVFLTEEQHYQLEWDYGPDFVPLVIKVLNDYKKDKNISNDYDDYQAILKWVIDAADKKYPRMKYSGKWNMLDKDGNLRNPLEELRKEKYAL